MSEQRREFSPIDRGFVRIERQPDGLRKVTVLRKPDGVEPRDVVCVHLRCRHIDVDKDVRLTGTGDTSQSLAPVVVYQSYRTKTVMIKSHPDG